MACAAILYQAHSPIPHLNITSCLPGTGKSAKMCKFGRTMGIKWNSNLYSLHLSLLLQEHVAIHDIVQRFAD